MPAPENRAFQWDGFFVPITAGGFQWSGFQETAFQEGDVAFQDTGLQITAFQRAAPAVPLAAKPVVARSRNVNAAALIARRRHHDVSAARAPSAPTATPLVRNRASVHSRAAARQAYVRLQRNKPLVLRQPMPAPVIVARPAVLVRSKRLVAQAARRRHRSQAFLGRAPLVTLVRQPLVLSTRLAHKRARLRHKGMALLLRAPSTTTPTPLVRKRLLLETVTQRRQAMASRARRKPLILRGVSMPTVPGVRPQVIVRTQNLRRPTFARLRRDRPLVLRSRVAPLRPTAAVVVPKARYQLLVRRGRRARPILLRPLAGPVAVPFIRRIEIRPQLSSRISARLGRSRRVKPQILRAPSATTTTPLIVKHIVVRMQNLRRPELVRLQRNKPLVLRQPMPVAVPGRTPPAPLVITPLRQALVRTRWHKPQIRRAPMPPPIPPRPRPALVRTQTIRRPELARLRQRKPLVLHTPALTPRGPRVFLVRPSNHRPPVVFRVLRNKPVVLRALLTTTPIRPVPIARTFTRRPKLVRLQHHRPVIVHAPKFATATPLVRKRLLLDSQTRNRNWVVSRRRHHNTAFTTNPGAWAGVVLPAQQGEILLGDLGRYGLTLSDVGLAEMRLSDTQLYDVKLGDLLGG